MTPCWRLWAGAALALGAASAAAGAFQPPWPEADLKLGEALIKEHKCTECHVRRVGGDGSDIYNPVGKYNNAALVRGMVQYCSTELNLALFPEDVSSVAAVLLRDHYKFPAAKKP
jgi:hypothetical protein